MNRGIVWLAEHAHGHHTHSTIILIYVTVLCRNVRAMCAVCVI